MNGGASDHVFGLMPFFGYRFAPRLRDIEERRLHLLPGQESGPLLAGMTAEPIALGYVAAHWDELLRFATSTGSRRCRRSSWTSRGGVGAIGSESRNWIGSADVTGRILVSGVSSGLRSPHTMC